jgi:hypothetical protein
MSLEDRLQSFLYSKSPGAIVLQGSWGRGKTYFWQKKIAADFLSDKRLSRTSRRYSYVSLFGVNSLADLKVAIFQASEESDVIGRGVWRSAVSIRWWWWLARKVVSLVLDNGDVPYTAAISKAYTALTFYSIRDRLICLDDIERRGVGLTLIDAMGLVAQLVEQRNCRVCVVLNSGKLGESDQPIWDANKEKVFIGELTYSPTTEQCIDLVLRESGDARWVPVAKRRLQQLNITNIRIVQRTKDFIETVLEVVKDRNVREETLDSIVSIVVLLVYSHSGKGEGAPPMDVVMHSNAMSDAVAEVMGKKKELTSEEKEWSRVLSDYGLYLGDELDIVLRNLVEVGYPDIPLIREVVDRFEGHAERQIAKEAWRNAWRLYHDHLDENKEQVLNAFIETWPAVSNHESAENVQSLAVMLRMLGRADLATQFIDTWVEQRKGARAEELAQQEYNKFGQIEDVELLDRIHNGFVASAKLPSLSDALALMADNYGRDDGAVAVIAATSAADLVKAIDDSYGPKLHNSIRYTLALQPDEQRPAAEIAKSRMREAIMLIAQRSEFSKHRIKQKFGVEQE